MPSPFPGMDPYIESSHLWEDFHDSLVNEIKNALARVLPDRYVVRAGERSYIVLEPRDICEEKHDSQADVAVLVAGTSSANVPASHAAAVLEAVTTEPPPVELLAMVEVEYRESFLETTGRTARITCLLVAKSGPRAVPCGLRTSSDHFPSSRFRSHRPTPMCR